MYFLLHTIYTIINKIPNSIIVKGIASSEPNIDSRKLSKKLYSLYTKTKIALKSNIKIVEIAINISILGSLIIFFIPNYIKRATKCQLA